MTAFGNQPGGQAPPTSGNSLSANGGNTEFERSVARSAAQEPEPADTLRQKIDDDMDAVKQVAESAKEAVTDKAAAVAETQKGYIAGQIQRFAVALEKVGDELQAKDPDGVGNYAKGLGTSARDFAERVQDKDLREIAAVAEDFGRRQPLAFLGMAALAGLAASRFMMATPPRSPSSMPAGVARPEPISSNPAAKETYNG